MSGLTPCDCGYGENWYHTSKDHLHEYNEGNTPTAEFHKDRDPLACFFGCIDCRKVIAIFAGKETSFMYSKYEGTFSERKNKAMADAAAFINNHINKMKQEALF